MTFPDFSLHSWNLECVHEPGFGREKPVHAFKNLKPLGFVAYDDLIHINTQSGSQWDGFRMFTSLSSSVHFPPPCRVRVSDEKP